MQRGGIDLLGGDRTPVEGRQPRFLFTDAFQCAVPARFELRRHQAHVGVDALVSTGGELRVIPRLLELEVQRLPLLPILLAGPLRRREGGVDRLRGDRQQDLLAHRVVDGLAGAGHAGRTTRLVVAPQTAKGRRRAVTAAVADLEHVAAAATP